MKTLTIILGFLVACLVAQKRPPNYSLDDMPDTNFNCRDKILGGYYADPETDCQMFHVCVKVPGVGVQDYRFLCPNDTSFDQENQICANWFDIDCEAAALYYSDNFDLYRIGYNPSSPTLGTSNVTPIPLGPSSVRPPIKAPVVSKSRPRYQNSRPSDDEEDYFLQRSETGDSRLQQKDLLRGSSSGNFFNSNKGKEDEDEDETYRDHKENTPSNENSYRHPSNGNKKKVAVRKLVKRPNNNSYVQDGDNYQTPRSASVPSSTFSQNTHGSSNYDNYNYNGNQRNRFGSQQQQYYNTGNYQSPGPFTTSTYNTPTTERSTYVENNDRTTRTGSNYYQQRYNTIQRNNAPSSTTLQPLAINSAVANNYNYQQRSESTANTRVNSYNAAKYYSTFSEQKSTTPKPIQYSASETTTANYYNNYQSQQRNTNTQRYNIKNTGANIDNYPTTANNPVNSNSNYNFANYNTNGQKHQATNDYTKSTINSYYTTTLAPSTYVAYNSDNDQKRYGNGYNQRSTDYSNTKSTAGFISTTLVPVPSSQAYNNYQRSNNEDYNNFSNYNYQRTNKKYGHNNANADDFETPDDKTDEFLKTAPSNNYRPSGFNTFQNNYNTNSKSTTVTNNYNYTSTTGSDNRSSQNHNNNYYNINTTPKTTSFISSDAYTSDKQSSNGNSRYNSQTTIAPSGSFRTAETYPTTRGPQTTSQNYPKQTFAPSASKESISTTKYQQQRNNYNGYSGSSTTVRTSEYDKTAANDAKKSAAPESKSGSKTSDVSYDYAYYDDGNTEYDGLDPISDHHFGKGGESFKVARSGK